MDRKTLKAIRLHAGLSQEEFAEKIGVKRPTVITWEVGRSPINKVISRYVRLRFPESAKAVEDASK